MDILETYTDRWKHSLKKMAEELEKQLLVNVSDIPRVDRVSVRAKSPDRFYQKAIKVEGGTNKYNDPLNEIQDQIGARIIVFYLQDVEEVDKVLNNYYRPIETKKIVPDSDSEFGYFGKHYIFKLPKEMEEFSSDPDDDPDFFELQVKTLFQHAWSEANHDLGYKPDQKLDALQKRKIAFTAAQAWGADEIFAELHAQSGQG